MSGRATEWVQEQKDAAIREGYESHGKRMYVAWWLEEMTGFEARAGSLIVQWIRDNHRHFIRMVVFTKLSMIQVTGRAMNLTFNHAALFPRDRAGFEAVLEEWHGYIAKGGSE